MSKKTTSNILLLITSVIWGAAFVAQKAGTSLGPFTYNGVRFLLACAALLPVILITSRKLPSEAPGDASAAGKPEDKRILWAGGISCGIVLAIAASLQQFGLYFDTDAGKAGFITALYIVIVPVLGLFLHKKVGIRMWLCILIGAIGFYLLTMAGKGTGFTLQKGDLMVLLCAIVFSVHILVIDHFSPKCNGIKMSCIQFLVAGTICIILMFFFEKFELSQVLDCWLPILYTGIMSSAVGYTLQIVAQKNADPATASLIMSLESVFAVLTGALIYHERLTGIEFIGCVVIFAAVIISQLPSKEARKLP